MTEQNKSEVSPDEQIERDKTLFAQLQKLKLIDLNLYPYRTQEKIIGKYTREQLKKAMDAPELEANQKQLRNISKFLFNASTHYKRLVLYFAELLTLDYYVEPYGISEPEKVNIEKAKKAYQDTINLLENMNVKHEFGKVLQFVFKEGAYFGYIHQNKDSFFLQQLDADYTKITYIEDGVFGLAFNFQYFFVYPERLKQYPAEFQRIYNEKYGIGKGKKGRNNFYWEDLSSENTITIKFDETVWYVVPPFIGIFDSLLDISDFKELAKAKEEIGNYKLITMKIPMKTDGQPNDYLITGDHIKVFQDNVAAVVPEQIGVATIPMEVDTVDFERDKVDKNLVAESTSQLFSEMGVSELLFNSDKNGSVGLTNSVKTDDAVSFSVLRQIERWICKYLKQFNGDYKFRIVMPEISNSNKQEFNERQLKNAQFGLPVKLVLVASAGLKPSAVTTMTFWENEVLKLDQKFVPLKSSHTSTDNQGAGRPTEPVDGLTDEGARKADQRPVE